MAKESKLQEQLAEELFPVNGLNVSTVYDSQPTQTTPVGLNVRTFETLTRRGRGGVRPGLSRYINAQVSGFNKIQHLTYIVDPQAEALAGGSPSGDQTAPNRNLFGGMGGFGPVRWPIEPGRTYPTAPITFNLQFVVECIGGFDPGVTSTGALSLNGRQIVSAVANVTVEEQTLIQSFGPFTAQLRPAGTNTLVVTWAGSIGSNPEGFAYWVFTSTPYTNNNLPSPAWFAQNPTTTFAFSQTVMF
jgi:hypothetical protein